MEAAKLRLGLAEQVPFGEQDLVVEPSQRLTSGSVAPSDDRAAGSVCPKGQLLDRDDLDHHSLGHGLMYGMDMVLPPGFGLRLAVGESITA